MDDKLTKNQEGIVDSTVNHNQTYIHVPLFVKLLILEIFIKS